jgi:hypothetical protein
MRAGICLAFRFPVAPVGTPNAPRPRLLHASVYPRRWHRRAQAGSASRHRWGRPTQRKKTQPSTSNIGESHRRCTQFQYSQRGPHGPRESESRHRVTNPGLSDPRAQALSEIASVCPRRAQGVPSAAEMSYPSGGGTSSPSVSHSRPIFTSSRDFDSETAIWIPGQRIAFGSRNRGHCAWIGTVFGTCTLAWPFPSGRWHPNHT